MSTIHHTAECFPEKAAAEMSRWLGFTVEPTPADHDRCQGGWSLPGLIGGWVCACPCHNATRHHVTTTTDLHG